MGRKRTRKCQHCRTFFQPDPRNARHQEYCSKSNCKRASKKASQHRWLNQPANQDYFKGPEQVARVRTWRKSHPDYWRRRAQMPNDSGEPLQDVLFTELIDLKKKSENFVDPALQDLLNAQSLVLLGLLANLTGTTLQDDIATTGKRMLRLGQDILNDRPSFRVNSHHANQTPLVPRAGPPTTSAI